MGPRTGYCRLYRGTRAHLRNSTRFKRFVRSGRTGAHPVASRDAGGLAFVINSGDASISLIDVATKQEVRRIPMVREPHHMALKPDHRFLVFGDTVANEMVVLDPVTGEVVRRVTVSDPYQFGYSPMGNGLLSTGCSRHLACLKASLV